nr:somatostatin receptor type 5-like [Misgurnus anguillicaudatus]
MNNSNRENLPWQIRQVLVPTLDAMVMVIGLVGHLLVIYILTGYRKKNGSLLFQGTDTLLLALSASDLLLILCLPFHTAAIALGYWPFSRLLCKTISFLGVACSSASVLTLAALAVSRYLIVVHSTWSFRLRMERWMRFSAILMWVPAIALGAPQFAFRTVKSTPILCFAFLSNLSQVVYSAILFLVGFALPLIIIVVMYCKLYRFLRRTRLRGAAPQLERYQRQVTQTSALLVLVFTLCWLPSYILMFLLASGTHSKQVYFAVIARLLASSSVIANPVLYAFMSHKFRQKMLALGRMQCRPCTCVSGRTIVQPFNPVEEETPS